jgi:hypothetical protein
MADLNLAQLSTLKAAILADPTQATNVANANWQAIADWLNAPDPAGVNCWKTSLTQDAVWDVMDWTVFINRSQGERDCFRMLFMGRGVINPSRLNVRRAFADIFSGTTAAVVNLRNALLNLFQRPITRGEKLFATPSADLPAILTLVVEGPFTAWDVMAAMDPGIAVV